MTFTVWHGDWRARINGFVRDAGNDSVAAFLNRYKGAPYEDVLDVTGLDAAPLQLAIVQIEEARRNNTIREAAKDAFVRFIIDRTDSGRQSLSEEFERVHAFVSWQSLLSDQGSNACMENLTNAVWSAFKAAAVPEGWRPSDENDPIVKHIFDLGWPVGAA